MTRVSQAFSLGAGPFEFINLHVQRDNRLFFDPAAIRNSRGRYARRAQRLLEDFFDEVMRCRTSASQADRQKGLRLLQTLHEPNETRLGMSRVGVRGHGFGDGLGERLWDELAANPACRMAAVSRLEDLKLFVDGVGDDLISDMSTRVAYSVLAQFTTDMMSKYSALLGRGVVTFDAQVWGARNKDWATTQVTLPDIAPHPLLLVPVHWTYWRQLMDEDAFYNRHATGTLQVEQTTVSRDGKTMKPTKKDLKKRNPDKRKLNVGQTAKYLRDDDQNLVERYRAEVDAEYVPMDDDQVTKYIK